MKTTTINEIIFIKGEGYRIMERPLGYWIDTKGSMRQTHSKRERYLYEEHGDECKFIQESIALESYEGLSNDYEIDLEIFRTISTHNITIAAYEAMKFVLENRTNEWSESPFSKSFYSSKDIDWGYKPEGSLRVSDHWNFGVEGGHCPTHDKEFKEGWAVGKFTNGAYEIIKIF